MKQIYKNTRRYSGVKMLSASLNNVTNPIFKKHGFAENKILTDWNFIVGKEMGNCSTPKKITFARDKKTDGVLHVEVYDSGVAMEVTYMEPVLIEKISVYFGYKAVARLKIIQRPGGQLDIEEKKKVPVRNITDEKKAILNGYIDDIDDDDLKEALGRLGADVMSDVGFVV